VKQAGHDSMKIFELLAKQHHRRACSSILLVFGGSRPRRPMRSRSSSVNAVPCTVRTERGEPGVLSKAKCRKAQK